MVVFNQRTIKSSTGRTIIIIIGILLAALLTWSSRDMFVTELINPLPDLDFTVKVENPVKEKLPEMVRYVVETVEAGIR